MPCCVYLSKNLEHGHEGEGEGGEVLQEGDAIVFFQIAEQLGMRRKYVYFITYPRAFTKYNGGIRKHQFSGCLRLIE